MTNNKHRGVCAVCGRIVDVNQGLFHFWAGEYITRHIECMPEHGILPLIDRERKENTLNTGTEADGTKKAA